MAKSRFIEPVWFGIGCCFNGENVDIVLASVSRDREQALSDVKSRLGGQGFVVDVFNGMQDASLTREIVLSLFEKIGVSPQKRDEGVRAFGRLFSEYLRSMRRK